MYTEIKELVNFLAVYMHHRIPRRRICLCMESYANHLVTKFHEKWRIEEPKHAESERILPIKTLDGLDEMFSAVATSIGVNGDDLFASFPTSIIVYCNPGEVTCRISEYPPTVLIWRGDINVDKDYYPTPIGAAKYYDGNTHNIPNTVLCGMPGNLPLGCSKNKEIKPERCVPLELVSSAGIAAYDLLGTGFLDMYRVPPILFRYTVSEFKPFTVRSFAATRFGSHRPRPDHEAMRRIQHAAAYLAVTSDSAMNAAAAAPGDGGTENMNLDIGPEGDHGNELGGDTRYDPFAPSSFPSEVSNYSPTVSVTDYTNTASAACVMPSHSTPVFGAVNSMPTTPNPARGPTNSDQFDPAPPSAPAAETVDSLLPWDITAAAGDIKPKTEDIGLPSYDEYNQHGFAWPYSPSVNVNDNTTSAALGSEYEIWKPAFTGDNNNSTISSFMDNHFFDTPIFTAPELDAMTRPKAIELSPLQPFNSPSNPEISDLGHNLSDLSLVDQPAPISPPNRKVE